MYISQPLTCEVVIESPIIMETDIGAEVSIILESTHKTLFPELQPAKFNVLLKTYNYVQKPAYYAFIFIHYAMLQCS